MRSLGVSVTREELESLKQELESVTRIFDFSLFFGAFSRKKHTSPRASGANPAQTKVTSALNTHNPPQVRIRSSATSATSGQISTYGSHDTIYDARRVVSRTPMVAVVAVVVGVAVTGGS